MSTDRPARAASAAVVRPVRPAPTTTTSQSPATAGGSGSSRGWRSCQSEVSAMSVLPVPGTDAGGEPDPATPALVLLLLRAGLVDVAGVAGRQLELPLGRDPGLELTAALELGVQLGAEQEREVGEPQPQQERDHAAERAVGAVVGGEVPDVEPEGRRQHRPADDRGDGADTHPAEPR